MTTWNVWAPDVWRRWENGGPIGKPLAYRRSERAVFALAGALAAGLRTRVVVSREDGLVGTSIVTPSGTVVDR